jgi:hypothetical protein
MEERGKTKMRKSIKIPISPDFPPKRVLADSSYSAISECDFGYRANALKFLIFSNTSLR